MGWPISALGVAAGRFAFRFSIFAVFILLLGWPAWRKKTHDRFQPWVLSKFASNATRPNGVAAYDDDPVYHQDLQRFD